jgi:hypothetical protein
MATSSSRTLCGPAISSTTRKSVGVWRS